MAADMLKAGQGLNYPELVRTVAEQSSAAVEWTVDEIGVDYLDHVEQIGGHSAPRTLTIKSEAGFHFGAELVRKMLKKAREAGAEIRTQACLQTLVQDAAGTVTGVVVREGVFFPKTINGVTKRIGARKGVVLASGGFANDVALRTSQDPRLTTDVETTNRRGATGEVITEALRIGAMPVHLSAIQLGPWATPDEKGSNVGANFGTICIFPHGIVVDSGTGQRLMNERADRKLRADAMLAAGRICLGIVDAQGAAFGDHFLKKCLEKGVVKAFDGLDQLARYYEVPADALADTVTGYNRALAKGRDLDFGRPVRKGDTPLAQPPFYAIRLWPKIHFTSGGIRIDTAARVIGINHQPIKGLFAAGEVTGGVHGACRLGSCAIPECLVFGRIAGRSAAAAAG